MLADYVSSHSYLDSILTTIDVGNVNLNVEFPEYGKRLMESPLENSQAQTEIVCKTWGDNWKVDGVDKFEEQLFIELDEKRQKKEKSLRSPEIVPFLVPSSGLAKVVIGDKDVDNISVLSEKMSEGSIEFSSSSQEMEEEEKEVIRTSHDTEVELTRKSCLVLVSGPADQTVTAGRILSLSCIVEGIKPIGEISAFSVRINFFYCMMWSDVCWFHGENVLGTEPHCILQQRGHLYTILIIDPAAHQSGLYSLAAINSQTEIWHSWRVNIEQSKEKNQAPYFVTVFQDRYFSLGEKVVTNCSVTGHPEPRVEFYKDGKLIQNNEMFSVGEMLLRSVNRSYRNLCRVLRTRSLEAEPGKSQSWTGRALSMHGHQLFWVRHQNLEGHNDGGCEGTFGCS